MTTGYHHAFIDPVAAGYLVTFMVSDGVTLYISITLHNRQMQPVAQLLTIRHKYAGGIDVEMRGSA